TNAQAITIDPAANVATGTITDDDAITASVAVLPSSVLEDATGATGTLVYTISLSHASAFATVVNYTLTGTAVEGSDYPTITTHSVTIAAGATSATVSIDPTTDAVFEGNETIIL